MLRSALTTAHRLCLSTLVFQPWFLLFHNHWMHWLIACITWFCTDTDSVLCTTTSLDDRDKQLQSFLAVMYAVNYLCRLLKLGYMCLVKREYLPIKLIPLNSMFHIVHMLQNYMENLQAIKLLNFFLSVRLPQFWNVSKRWCTVTG